MITPVFYIALPLLLAFLSPILERLRALFLTLFVTYLFFFGISLSFFEKIKTSPINEVIVIAPPLGINLYLDYASLLFITLFSLAAMVVFLFLWLDKNAESLKNRASFIFFMLLLVGCNGMVLTGDVFNLYVFFEIAGISAYSLSAIQKDKKGLESGLKYLIIGSIASVFLLFCIVLLYLQTGTLNIAELATKFSEIKLELQFLIATLGFVGLGIKCELFPLNFWVPDIYQGSPTLVNSLFSGVVVKSFIFVLFHLLFLFHLFHFGIFLSIIGGVSMVIAEIVALRQENIKRMLAYSSLGQVGLIVMALGFNDLELTNASLFLVINHTLFKILLFLTISLQKESTFASLKGSGITNSLFGVFFVFGALSVLGLPPFSGFIAKLWVLKGFAHNGLFIPIALVLISALFEAGYYFRWIKNLYSESEIESKPINISFLSYLPLFLISSIILTLGVFPSLIEPYVLKAGEAFMNSEVYINTTLGVAK